MKNLKDKNIAIIVGHEPGGGAAGERSYNAALAVIMRDTLRKHGANVYLHQHHTKGYGQRMREMRAAILSKMPHCDACIELHFNSYYKESAHGHEFMFRGSRSLAEAFRDEFQLSFPNSTPRADNGIRHSPTGRGAGFLKQAPAWAVLVEPFFGSNHDESQFFMGRQTCLAETYCRGLNKFFS